MCGIVGVIDARGGEPVNEDRIRRMLAMIRHRGPDQFGIYLAAHAGLGSARLSIVDIDGGQQPIGNEDGSRWIVFNGEVYNHRELREELEARGHLFVTGTDTEVVLHAYEEYGPGCLSRFNGQFAIAIWDEDRQELFLARDPFGITPLFYTRKGSTLLFGSEVKALLSDPSISAELDPQSLVQIFTYWSPLSPGTAFRGIQQLPAGHYLHARRGEVTVRSYWKPVFPARGGKVDHRSVADCVDEFRHLLNEAVRLRLQADVPIGAYLSGGLDSSTIAALAHRLGSHRLDTFSIAFGDSQFDESPFQRLVATHLGTDHQVLHASHEDIGRVFPEVIWHTEMPILRTSPAPMFLLSKLVQSRGYKVVLTGEGADEQLAGYDIFKEAMIRRFWAANPNSQWRPLLLQRLYPDIQALAGTPDSYLRAFFGAGLEDVDGAYYSHLIRWRTTSRSHRFFSEDLKHIASEPGASSMIPGLPEEFTTWHPLARAQYIEMSVFLSQYLLSSQADRPAMAHSVEARFPFLDPHVTDFCSRLPVRLKLAGLTEKRLLREVAKDLVPEEICSRGKRPYRAPIHRSFFNASTQDYVGEVLGSAAVRRAGFFNPGAVEKLVARIHQGRPLGETDDMALVGILSTQLVHRLFVEDFPRLATIPLREGLKRVDRRSVAGVGQPSLAPAVP